MAHIQTQSEWEEEMGKKIVGYLKSQIYLDLPFMGVVIHALTPVGNERVRVYGTDGACLYFNPVRIIELFKTNERFLERAYLHSLLHCIYLHLWTRGMRDTDLWNLSCDIMVEHVIDGIDKPCTRRILTWIRQKIYADIKERKLVSAAQIYAFLSDEISGGDCAYDIGELVREFYTDDHVYWPDGRSKTPSYMESSGDLQKQWEKRARQMTLNRDRNADSSQNEVHKIAEAISLKRNRHNYRDFLKKFTVSKEELSIDLDSFDLAYYDYGIRTYGNLPLIEPLETKEVKRIQELVIVIDTSYSTNGELVSKFLQETLNILLTEAAFFKRCSIRLLQCDDQVRSDTVITSAREAKDLFSNFELKGGGNTDFRQAFTYINELIEKKEIKNLGGVLYFTDGLGTYPAKKPAYKTAFVYLKDYDEEKVPVWAAAYVAGNIE